MLAQQGAASPSPRPSPESTATVHHQQQPPALVPVYHSRSLSCSPRCPRFPPFLLLGLGLKLGQNSNFFFFLIPQPRFLTSFNLSLMVLNREDVKLYFRHGNVVCSTVQYCVDCN